MRLRPSLFLKAIILLMATAVLAGLIRFPQTEGRAAHLDLIGTYTDPFILYMYIGSTPFFIGLYQTFKLLNFIDGDEGFSRAAVHTLRNLKFAALSLIGFVALALVYIRFFAHGDDPAGPTALGILVIFASGATATAASVVQKLLQTGVDIKSADDLTV